MHVEGRRGPAPILPTIKAHPHSEAASITGGYVYRGTACLSSRVPTFMATIRPESSGRFARRGKGYVGEGAGADALHLAAFGETNDGELLLVDHDRTHQIYRLTPTPGVAQQTFPRRLSETGLFASVREQRPAPGVLPYEINSKLWSDGAIAERFLAIPGTAKIGLDGQGTWQFPEGSVLARTISLELEPGKRESRRRMETQVLHLETGAWRPYSYLWNDNQDDAELVGALGASTIKDGERGKNGHTGFMPGRNASLPQSLG